MDYCKTEEKKKYAKEKLFFLFLSVFATQFVQEMGHHL